MEELTSKARKISCHTLTSKQEDDILEQGREGMSGTSCHPVQLEEDRKASLVNELKKVFPQPEGLK